MWDLNYSVSECLVFRGPVSGHPHTIVEIKIVIMQMKSADNENEDRK